MTVSVGREISIEYTLRHNGEVIDSNVSQEPLTYIHGQQQIISGLEEALDGMKVGEEKQVSVPPEKGYGDVEQEALVEVAKEQIPEDAHEVGAVLQSRDPEGNVLRSRVSEVKGETLILDFNHPLAGMTLEFDVRVVEVR